MSEFQSLNVLVVDDDDLMLHQIQLTLNKVGINDISLLNNGTSALETITSGNWFDIIFLDLNMPQMDGIEVMRNLAVFNYTGAVALFSGEDFRILKTAESLASAHNLNVIGTLSKPVTVDSIQALLEKYKPHQQKAKHLPVERVDTKALLQAILDNQIQPFFQPKVNTSELKIVSAEVLARWIHPEKGIIPPIAFIPVAEETGLIDRLTLVLFESSMRIFSKLLNLGYQFSLGINISADNLERVDLPERLFKLASAHGIEPQQIELEITESRLMENITTCLDVLTRLRLKGFGLSIDDFGTGYSSMAQLNQVPFTELKIDQAFVHGASDDPAASAILEASVELAKKLKMTIVAEGVEDQADCDKVTQLGCDLIQGYYISKPLSAEDFELWLENSKQRVNIE